MIRPLRALARTFDRSGSRSHWTTRHRVLAAYLVLYLVSGGGMLPAAWADTFFVDPIGGDDSGDGSVGDPWKTLTHALAQPLASGDVIEAAAGTYNTASGESFPITLVSGVTLRGAGSEASTARGSASIIEHETTIFEAINISLDSNTVIEGFTLDGLGEGEGEGGEGEEDMIVLSASFSFFESSVSMSPLIQNNELRNGGEDAIDVGFDNPLGGAFRGTFRNNVFSSLEDDGFEINFGGEGNPIEFDLEITGNTFTGIGEDGIDIGTDFEAHGSVLIRDNDITADGAGVEVEFQGPQDVDESTNVLAIEVVDNLIDVGEDGIDIGLFVGEGVERVEFDALVARNDVTAVDTGIDVLVGEGWRGGDSSEAFVDADVEVLNNTVVATQRGIEATFGIFEEPGQGLLLVDATVAGNQVTVNAPDIRGGSPWGDGDGIFVQMDPYGGFDETVLNVTVQNNLVDGAYDDGIQLLLNSHSESESSPLRNGGVLESNEDGDRPARRGGSSLRERGDPSPVEDLEQTIEMFATIAGNTISGVADDGIEIYKGSPQLSESWTGSTASTFTFTAGIADVAQTVRLIGNDITGAPGTGIEIYGQTESLTNDRGAAVDINLGLQEDYTFDRNELFENRIVDGAGWGVTYDQYLARLYDGEEDSASQLVAECNAITGNALGAVQLLNYQDGPVSQIDWGGGALGSNGLNSFINVGPPPSQPLRSDPPLEFDNAAYSSAEEDVDAINNYWGVPDPTAEVNGAVSFFPVLYPSAPTVNVSVSLTSEVSNDVGGTGLTVGDTVRYTATITSDGDCGCAAADFTVPVPEGSTLVEDSVESYVLPEEIRGGGGDPPKEDPPRGVDLSDEGQVRVGLGGLGVEVIEITWEIEFGSCMSEVQAEVVCSPVGTVLSNTVALDVGTFDLNVTKTDNLTQATPGTAHQYEIVVTGDPTCAVTGVEVTDELPDVLLDPTWTCSASAGSTCTAASSGDINDTISLAPAGTATYTVNSVINTIASGTLTNTVEVDATSDRGSRGFDFVTATDETELLSVPAPSISAAKSVSGEPQVGATLTYEIVLANSSPTFAPDNAGDEFVDVLPAGLELVSASATSGTVTEEAPDTVRWNGQIPGNGSVTITIEALVLPTAEGEILLNQAVVAVDNDLNGSNETEVLSDDPVPPGAEDPTAISIGQGQNILEIPTLGPLGGALMVLLLSGCAVLVIGRRFGA